MEQVLVTYNLDPIYRALPLPVSPPSAHIASAKKKISILSSSRLSPSVSPDALADVATAPCPRPACRRPPPSPPAPSPSACPPHAGQPPCLRVHRHGFKPNPNPSSLASPNPLHPFSRRRRRLPGQPALHRGGPRVVARWHSAQSRRRPACRWPHQQPRPGGGISAGERALLSSALASGRGCEARSAARRPSEAFPQCGRAAARAGPGGVPARGSCGATGCRLQDGHTPVSPGGLGHANALKLEPVSFRLSSNWFASSGSEVSDASMHTIDKFPAHPPMLACHLLPA